VKTGNLIVRAIATTLVLGLAGLALAEALDIQPGLWKKTLKVETGGRTVMDSTIDACLTADDLDLQKTATKLAQSPSCKVVQQQLTPQRLEVVLQCKGMRIESTTEVRSRDAVAVAATMTPADGGEVTQSKEAWSFVKADCGK
jgi:hypothetical protein